MIVLGLQRSEHILEAVTRSIHLLLVAQSMQDEVVVFVDQHHYAFAGLFMQLTQKVGHANVSILYIGLDTILSFIAFQRLIYQRVQLLDGLQVTGTEVKPQYRVPLGHY